jgi:hypothetical protein
MYRTSREPIDRRQVRLIYALLAFPVAGVIGFAGNAVVARIVSQPPAMTSPPPERTTDEHPTPHERRDSPDADDGNVAGVV